MPSNSDVSYNIYFLVPLVQVAIAFNLAYLALDFFRSISALSARKKKNQK